MRAEEFIGAPIVAVEPESPADDAGFTPGGCITAVDGGPIRDIVDWRWLSDGCEIEVSYIDAEGDGGSVLLERESGIDWGFSFDGVVFDEVRQCRNACLFCFMRQLPDEARPSLTLRDDDFRLSFLQGTFCTFTNLEPQDEARIEEQAISPLRYSLHAVTPSVRARLMGRHAAAGFEAAERLLASGIGMHAQVVLMPGINDGEELERTLSWAWAHPGILTIGIVPVGYTRYQSSVTESFGDKASARRVIEAIAPYQNRALIERGEGWAFASDEFYRSAYPDDLLDQLPPTEVYGDFSMFEDGIGIIRSFVDDWGSSQPSVERCALSMAAAGMRVHFVVGFAQREFFIPLVEESSLRGLLVPLPVENDYFGGNVDVTGLLVGSDIARALRASAHDIDVAVVPEVIFNEDGMTLDDMTISDMEREAGMSISVVPCAPSGFLAAFERFAEEKRAR